MSTRPPVIMPGPQAINLEGHLRALQLVQAKIALHTARLAAWDDKCERERNLLSWYVEHTIDPAHRKFTERHPVRMWLDASKAHQKAEGDLMRVETAELQAQAAVYAAQIEQAQEGEGKPKLHLPGGN